MMKHLISSVQIKCLNVGEMTLVNSTLIAKCRDLKM